MRRTLLSLALRLALSGALIGLLLWRIDVGAAARVARDADYLYVLPALPIFTLSKLVDAHRWRLMLYRVGSPPLGGLLGIYLVSNMVNALMPVRVGDLVRVQVPARRYGLPRAGLTASVYVTESLLDGVIFAVLLLAALAFFDIPTVPLSFVWGFAGIVLLGLAVTIALARLELNEGWEERGPARRLPGMVRTLLSGALPEFLRGLALLKEPRPAAMAAAATLAAWLLETVVFFLFGKTFGLGLTFADYIVVMVTANLIVSMPVLPSNVGPYEVAVAGVVSLLGASASEAAAYALGAHLINIAWVSVSGLAAMWLMGLTPGDALFLRREERGEDAGVPAEAG